MSDDSFNVRSAVLAQIAKTNDDNLRAVLVLMLGVLEEIGSKIDTVLRDEEKLRGLVLNGHSKRHGHHHDWLDRRIAESEEIDELIERGKPVLAWAEQKIAEEKTSRADNRSTLRKMIDKALENLVTIAITALATTVVLTK